MTEIEAAETIVKQNGNCEYVKCGCCPGGKTYEYNGLNTCCILWSNNKKKQWFENWLNENKQKEQKEKTYPVYFTDVELKRVIENLKNVSDSIYMKIFKAIDKANKPQIGDRCAFWNEDKSDYSIGYLESIDNSREKYNMASRKDDVKDNIPCDCFKNCAKIKKDAEF